MLSTLLSRTEGAEDAEMCVVMAIDAYRCEIHDGSRGGTEPRSSAFLIFNSAFSIHACLPAEVTVGAVWANRVLPNHARQICAS